MTIHMPVAELRDLRRLSLRHPVSCFRFPLSFSPFLIHRVVIGVIHAVASTVLQPRLIAPLLMTKMLGENHVGGVCCVPNPVGWTENRWRAENYRTGNLHLRNTEQAKRHSSQIFVLPNPVQ